MASEDIEEFEAAVIPKEHYKNWLENIQFNAISAFEKQDSIQKITKNLVKSIDALVISLFQDFNLTHSQNLILLAVGGYGRRELQLHSDIDLLILHENKLSPQEQAQIETFIQTCWDIGLDISHQITQPQACATLAEKEITVISSLLDARILCGNPLLLENLQYLIHPLHIWKSEDFFDAKQKEQDVRYTKYNETAYNLEPNIKNGPGGLRDIHIILHIAKRHFKIKKLSEGVMHGFLTEKDYEELVQCRRFLWRVRFALHVCAQKKEDKLLFEYQTKIAPLLHYRDKKGKPAIESLMKDYFKVIKRTRELNDIILQWLSEAIFAKRYRVTTLDNAFQLVNEHIEVKSPHLFATSPEKLLTLFLWIAKMPDIKGVKASTIRLIHQSTYLINQAYRNNISHQRHFLELFKPPNNPYDALRHMNRYGVLGRYLPCFQQVIGQMQYDLFHIYTVDQHALFVIRNMTRYLNEESSSFPLCTRLMKSIPKRDILYLSALFHDIAKGRGGDHSELGAEEVDAFAKQHQLNQEDRALLVWLVRHHLFMSHTAQRKDIYDIEIIAEFCKQLPHSHYLDYLYILTVADICATNPKLWNSWKDALLKELYYAAKLYLHQEDVQDDGQLIEKRKEDARQILHRQHHQFENINQLWSQLHPRYFMHQSAKMIAEHTLAILSEQDYPIVRIQPHHSEAAMELFVYMPHQNNRFAITTAILNNCHVTIQEANILSNAHNFDLDTYVILDTNHPTSMPENTMQLLQQQLKIHLSQNKTPRLINKRITRLHAHFNFVPQITFQQIEHQRHTQLLLITSDRPGLLADISQIFLKSNIHVHYAKIVTAGERAEDTFSITNSRHEPLSIEEQETLRTILLSEMKNRT